MNLPCLPSSLKWRKLAFRLVPAKTEEKPHNISMKAGRSISAAIFLENMNFWGRHGVMPEERKLGGQFRVDMKLDVDAPARYSDRIEETADYRVLFSRTRALVEQRHFRTLEALASAVADAAMKVKRVNGARVKVTKLAPPLGNGTTAAVEVREGTMKR